MPESRLRHDAYGNRYLAELLPGERVMTQVPPGRLPPSSPFRPVCQWCKGTLGADGQGQCGGCGAPMLLASTPAHQPSPIWR